MKIVLIQPPVQDFYDTDVRLQPIGLCYLKACAQKHHPDVDVIVRDYHCGHGRQTIPLPKELKYLKEFYAYPDKSPFSAFYHYYHFGLDFDQIVKDIRALAPNVVGISSLFTPYYREVLTIAQRLKEELHLPILVGGSHVSAVPESILISPFVNYVIRGEGERPFVEFIEYLKGHRPIQEVSNLGYKVNGEMVFNSMNENYGLEEIPLPDLSDLEAERYSYFGRPMTFMITSRSCPHKCSFCSVHLTFGQRYRRRSIDSVMEEIEQRYQEGYRLIDFEDDNLTFYKKEMKELCRRLIDRFKGKDLEFVAMNGISYLSLDDELLELMKEAGFTHLNLALVSSDKVVRETTKRPHTIEAYIKVVNKAFSLGFKIVSYQILGLPNESLDSMIQTLAFNTGQPVLLGASMFYQTPNSPIAKGLTPNELDMFKARLTAMAIETEQFSRQQIYTLFLTTRIFNFLKGLPLDKDQTLVEVLEKNRIGDLKQQLGIDLLRELFVNRKFHFFVKDQKIENHMFQVDLFFDVLRQCEMIRTLNGHQIYRLNSLL